MKKAIFTWTLFLLLIDAMAQVQDSIDLGYCLMMASERSPINRQIQIAAEGRDLKIKNLNSSWLPSIGIQAQANYNSETINFSDLMEGIPVSLPEIPLDQYKVWAEINQTLFDGGATAAQKAVEQSVYRTETQQTEVDLYRLKQQVLQVYFSLLLLDKNREVLAVSLDGLRDRVDVLQTGLENGVVLPEDLMTMQAEVLRMEQLVAEANLSRQSLIHHLSVLVDTILPADPVLRLPAEPVSLTEQVDRPEYALFDQKLTIFDASKKLVTAADMPRVFAFSQVAYGRPGYNMISDRFHDFYSVGIGIKWDFLHYGNSRRQKKLLDLQKDMVDVQRESFDDQLTIQLKAEKNNVSKYGDLVAKDEEILKLRKEITASNFSRLNHGVISATDYIAELNREILANLQLEQHRLQRLQASYNYLFLQGDL